MATLARGEELVVIGGDKDGFINVQTAKASGWVKIVLVQKQSAHTAIQPTLKRRARKARKESG